MQLFYAEHSMIETGITHAPKARGDEQPQQSAFADMMPGRQLAARREDMGMSVEQAASQLNLAPRQIQAIEADNYAALPGMATARGFVRAYAKLLRIDPAPLLASIAAEATVVDEAIPLRRALSSKPFSDNRLSAPNERSGFFRKMALGVGAAAALLAVLFAGEKMGWISIFPESMVQKIDRGIALLWDSPRPAPAAASAGAAASVQENVRQALPPVDRNPVNAPAASAAMPTPVTAASNASVPVAAAVALASAAVSAPPSEAAAQTPAAPTTTTDAGNALVLKLREDSWIEIRKSNGTAVIARLVKAGSTESFNLTGPVSLNVGNASGVDATLRGAPLELHAQAKNNVARLNLK
jgi:cytoskeleton protein RodZ